MHRDTERGRTSSGGALDGVVRRLRDGRRHRSAYTFTSGSAPTPTRNTRIRRTREVAAALRRDGVVRAARERARERRVDGVVHGLRAARAGDVARQRRRAPAGRDLRDERRELGERERARDRLRVRERLGDAERVVVRRAVPCAVSYRARVHACARRGTRHSLRKTRGLARGRVRGLHDGRELARIAARDAVRGQVAGAAGGNVADDGGEGRVGARGGGAHAGEPVVERADDRRVGAGDDEPDEGLRVKALCLGGGDDGGEGLLALGRETGLWCGQRALRDEHRRRDSRKSGSCMHSRRGCEGTDEKRACEHHRETEDLDWETIKWMQSR